MASLEHSLASTALFFPLSGNVEIYDWQAQGRELAADVVNSDKYKSVALHAEVKLAEALSRCDRLSPAASGTSTITGEPQPDKLRTAVCCQLLGEFAELCGPFSNVLRSIRDELVDAVYSSLYSSDQGLLVFDQLPWFTVAERLQAEKDALLEEREQFTSMLHEQQAAIQRIEQQMDTYQRAALAAQTEAGLLRSKLEALAAGEEMARNEAKTGREELKRLRKEWLRMKDELSELQQVHKKKETDKDSGGLRAELQQLHEAVEQTRYQLYIAQDQLAASVPATQHNELQQGMKELQMQLSQAKQQVSALEVSLQEAEENLGSSTPRPSCRALHAFGIQAGAGLKTQDLVAAAAEKLAEMTTALHSSVSQAAELEMVVVEDPPPAEVHLSIATDALPYFITEGAGTCADGAEDTTDSNSGKHGTVSAEALGRGPHVPRCLRRRAGCMVTGLQRLSLEATETLVLHIWKCKLQHERLYPPQHLQSYLYTYFSQQWGSMTCGSQHDHDRQHQQDSAHQGRAVNAAGRSIPGARHHAVTQQAYTLYHALSCHSRISPTIHLFHQVLSGQLSEGVFKSQVVLASTVLAAASTAAKQHASGSEVSDSAVVPTPAMLEALQLLGRHLPPYKLNRLQESYCTSVHAISTTYGTIRQLLQPLCMAVDPTAQSAQLQSRIQQAIASDAEEERKTADEDAAAKLACGSHEEENSTSHDVAGEPSLDQAPAATSSVLHGGSECQLSSAEPTRILSRQQAAASSAEVSSHTGFGVPADMTATLGNAWVNTLLQLHLEQHLEHASVTDSAMLGMQTIAASSTCDQPSIPALGGKVTLASVVNALQQAGLQQEQAAQLAIRAVLQLNGLLLDLSGSAAEATQQQARENSGDGPAAVSQHQQLLYVFGSQLTWSGLVLRKLRQQYSNQLLQAGQGFPDVLAVLNHMKHSQVPGT